MLKSKNDVKITSNYGWSIIKEHWGSLWFKGYIFEPQQLKVLVKDLLGLIEVNNEEDIGNYLANIDGHFAIVLQTPDTLFAAVDRIRSVPLFYTLNANNIIIIAIINLE